MPTLQLRFPGGRYHATPWGHHVNEGLIEWPPCPWRVLRALIACGFSTQYWQDVPPAARGLIDKLAAVLPSYSLPEASAAHSRHFMPVGVLEKGREKTTLVFDTWANVGDGSLLIHWPCDLSDEEAVVLRQLAACLGYLGRSESWVDGEVVATGAEQPREMNATPHIEGMRLGRQWEQVSLIAPQPPQEYARWRRGIVETALASLPLPEGKKKPPAKLLKERVKAAAPYPENLLECLMKDTVWWKQHAWSQPPGSQRVLYWRRSDALQVGPPQRLRLPAERRIQTFLLALTTPSGRTSALPSCRRTLPQAELLHRQLVGRVANGGTVQCPELTGCDERGRPLKEGHIHTHILPVDLDGDGHLDHFIVHAPMGLAESAQHAIRTLCRTWTKGGGGDLQLAVAGSGDLNMLRSLPARLARRAAALLGPSDGTRTWVSATPFVPPRFLKSRGRNTLVGQVNAELNSRGFPSAERVHLLSKETAELRHFVRRRQQSGNSPPADVGYAIKLEFAKPIRLKQQLLMLGYGSHFGLGVFVATDSANA